MNKIDISNWKKYKLTDLFEINLPIGDIQAQKADDGKIPLVSSGKNNNGICKYIDKTSKSEIIQANTITIDMFGKVFFHDYSYYCVSHGRVNILIPKFKITKHIGLYIAKVIEGITIPKYEFLDMCSQGALLKEVIKLPTNKNKEPDWKHMESYMKKIMQESQKNIENLLYINNKKSIDTNNWRKFKVGDLFDIHPTKHYSDKNGKALSNRDLFDENGVNPVVVNSAYNNGVGGYTKKPCNEKGGIITFSDTTTSDAIFYQENDFVGYSHVQGMYPIKYKNKWNKYSMKFFEVVFHSRADSLGYNFINKFTRDLASRIVVKLPTKINKNNEYEPDWKYMEKYMKSVFKKAGKKVDLFTNIVK